MKTLLKAFAFIILFLTVTTVPGRAYDFPIPELGNCRDQQECHLYCAIPQYHATCWSYAVYGTKNVLGDESPEQKVSTLGITFPIAELGNCANLTDCKAYCSSTTNQQACQTFAQNHRLTNKEAVVEKAKEELGCTTSVECKTFCQQETNHDTCTAFAKKYHLKGLVKERLLDEAKKTLGCTTADECKKLCADKKNRDKCENLTKKLGVKTTRDELMEVAKEKLGCTSFEECKALCQNKTNQDKCRNFGQMVSEGAHVKNLERKGICTTSEECKKVCETTPEKCPGFPKRKMEEQRKDTKTINRGPGMMTKPESESRREESKEDLKTGAGTSDTTTKTSKSLF